MQIERRRGRHLLREARRGRGLRRRRHRRHPPALPAQSRQRRPRARAARSHALSFIVDDADVARAWSDADARQRSARLDVLVKVDVGFHRCGIDPERPRRRRRSSRDVAALPGLRFRGLLSHAGHAYGAASEAEIAAIAASEARVLARSGVDSRRRRPVSTRSASAPRRRARFSLQQDGHHRAAAGQLRVLRSHAGRARRGDVGRLRAHRPRARRQPAGGAIASSSTAAARR